MASNPGPSQAIGVDELKALETSVLKALCLTINTAGSELKYKILDSLSDDDFYFPILRAIFQTLSEMHRRGDYVISANLEEELQQAGIEMSAEFSIAELFGGSLPGLSDLNGWVARLKERSRSGIVPTVEPPPSAAQPTSTSASGRFEATIVKSLDEVKQQINEEMLKSKPSVAPPPAKSPASAPKTPPPKTPPPKTPPPALRKSSPQAASAPPAREKSSPAVTPSKRNAKAVLSSEGDDWASYMEDLASQQGKSFDTGFARLDEGTGGFSPGLMLLVDEDRERLFSFLKQVTDQFARESEIRCLYMASQLPKASLRIKTLSRLASVPAKDIEKGRLKKDSPDWQRIDSEGRRAASWLKRVFVYEVEEEIELTVVRELAKKLIAAAGDATCLVVIDSLEKVARRGGSPQLVLSQLKGLAESLDVLILTATTDPTLLSSKDADYAAVFREGRGGTVEMEVLQSGFESSTIVSFQYEPEICRFNEV